MTEATELFAQSMQKLVLDEKGRRIGVAVSGGGDSVALTLLMHEWAGKRGGEIHAFTVDHGLRPQASAEAQNVHEMLTKRGIRHDILTWEGHKPLTHIQERARKARYDLLINACKRENISLLAIAHNREDQVETFWMRLSKGSGLEGLAAMAPVRLLDGVRIIRPLLSFARADLRQACRDFGVEWIDDPSNVNEQFLRVKLRQFEDLLAGEGLTPQRLAMTLQKLEDAREALQVFAEEAAKQVLEFHGAGYVSLKREPLAAFPVDIQRRVLSSTLLAVAPSDYAPGFEALEQARGEIISPHFAGRTLAGCEIFKGRDDEALICREAAAAPRPGRLEEGMLWDSRFLVSSYRSEAGKGDALDIGILGEEGLAQLRQKSRPADPVFAALESLPFKVKKALPALWKTGNLMAVPYLNWTDKEAGPAIAEIRVTFVMDGAPKPGLRVKIV